MRVLIITHIFWPEAADFRNRALAGELVRRGHEVTVLAPFPNYPLGRIYEGYRMTWRQWEELDGIRVLRVPLYPDHSSSGFRRALNYGSFTLAASILGPLLLTRHDVVFVHASPMTLCIPARVFKLLYGCPILLDVVDLWPEAVAGSGMTSSKIVLAASKWIAEYAYRISSRIIALTAEFAEQMGKAGVPTGKVTVIPPWADHNVYFPAEPDAEFGREFGLEGKTCIVHAGNIGPFQDIGNVLSAAELLQKDELVRFVFIGSGQHLDLMKKLVAERGLANVVFAGRFPQERMAGILAWGTALLVSMADNPYLAITIPSKLAAYLAAELPIIAVAGGDVARLVADHRLGVVAGPGKPEELAEAVRDVLKMSTAERAEIGCRCGELFRTGFEKDLLRDRYIALLEELAAAP